MMTLEEQITQNLAREMAEQMDFDILADLLDWTRVEIPGANIEVLADAVLKWLDKHCHNEYIRHKQSFMFKDPKDASHFILKWK
jgi:phage host-nuclease inhibitor protein Gam